MNIGALQVSSASSLDAVENVSPVTANAKGTASSASTSATVSKLSDAADTLSHLSELRSSDPEKFQSTMKDLASQLHDAANARGGEEGQRLNALADKVTDAAKTGDLSALKPPSQASGYGRASGAGKPPPTGGAAGPPKGGPPPSAASSTKKASDPADTNKDGTVSAAEKQAYAAKLAKSAKKLQATTTATAKS